MSSLPADIINQSLDAIGSDIVIGDPEEGTREAQVCLRAYGQCVRQLLRAAHWNFARKQAPMVLLADATGQTPNVGTMVPGGQFIYEYQYPIDCMKARFVPWNWQNQTLGPPSGNIQIGSQPLMTGLGQAPSIGQPIRPARWVEATDFNYPAPAGQITWEVQGVSPQGRTVILTNVQNAQLVYTALMLYPSVWDSQFRAAMVAFLAGEIALPIWAQKDRKFGMAIRTQQISVAKQKIMEARVTDGREGVFSSDIPVDWMNFRNSGRDSRFGDGAGIGHLWGGWDCVSFGDGSSY